MTTIQITYDGIQHCTALQEKNMRTVPIDCPYTGKGLEFSSGELVAAGVASCMLMSMGSLAQRNKIDLTNTRVEADFALTKDFARIDAINLRVNMPSNFSRRDRIRLERAAEACPIKHSFHPDTKISVQYSYPE
jgi:putative redox protein